MSRSGAVCLWASTMGCLSLAFLSSGLSCDCVNYIFVGGMDQMLAMADGTRLATDVYPAAGSGKYPIVLSRTPYDRKEPFNADRGTSWGGAGVVYMVQDARGQFGSEGTADFFGSDMADGQHVLGTLAGDCASNGHIALVGNSAPGIMAYMAMPNRPSTLDCAWVEVATGNLYKSVFSGGVFRSHLVQEWLSGTNQTHMLAEIVAHPLDDTWWDARQVIEQVDWWFPSTVHLTGWFDIFTLGQIEMFQAMQAGTATTPAEATPSRQHLIIGPWSHNTLGAATTGQLTFPNGALDIGTMQEDWLAYYLLGTANDVPNWPAVQYFAMGDVDAAGAPGNEWRQATTWPPFTAANQTLYLRAGGALNETAPGAAEGFDQYTYDPTNPVPTTGGNNMLLADGPYDQVAAVESRPDVVTYTTAALTAPLEVTGTVHASMWIQADVTDTDISVRLSDVYPDGRSMLITEEILRTRFRSGSFTSETLMTPGTAYLIEFDLWPTSIVFNTGHRIRVAVTSSNSPRFDANPNTGDAFRANSNTQIATVKILHEAAHPSSVVLPTAP
ncbi:MAG: CocE/NonD family hydrolase [Phycisphaerales bacterium]|nr:MAG: CocE/NonD family hydrolase [Phycisphaerales bacterium]